MAGGETVLDSGYWAVLIGNANKAFGLGRRIPAIAIEMPNVNVVMLSFIGSSPRT
jgi:hypothetical protein